MAEHPNVELIRRLVAARLTMDAEVLQDILGEDVVWHIPGEGQWAGDIRGRDALIALWTGVADEGSSLSFDVHDVLANDEHAVALANVTMNRREKGPLPMRSVWIFHCSGAKVTEGWFFDEDPAATSAFWS
jgi:ketosteroid isomerase-like protein